MANISTSLTDWSATAGSNQPDSSDTNTIQADLQAIQAAVKGAFPNVGGAVNATHTELNYVDGVTSSIQTQINAKAASGANSDITSLAGLTTPLSVAQGGTGAATFTLNNVILGNGTSAPQAVAPGTSGNVLTSDGTTWESTAIPDASETVKGIVELATTAEAVTGTDTARAVTPAGVKAATDALTLGAFTLLGTLTTTSGQTQTLSSLDLSGYTMVLVLLFGVSSTATNGIRLGTATLTSPTTVATEVYGSGWLDLGTGNVAFAGTGNNSTGGATGYSNLTTSLVFDADSGGAGTFDNGSIRVYGVK